MIKKFPCQDSLSTITPIVYFWGTTMVLGLSLTSGQMAFVTSQVNLTVFAKKYSNKFLSHFTLIISWSQFSWIIFFIKSWFYHCCTNYCYVLLRVPNADFNLTHIDFRNLWPAVDTTILTEILMQSRLTL